MEELLSIPRSTYFTQIDLKQGYHQIKLSKDSICKTGFVILHYHYEYLKIPLGLSNAPRFFQRIMRKILGHLSFISIFLDDIFIFFDSESDHIAHLYIVWEILKENNFTINFFKSNLLKDKIVYLGHKINYLGIKPDTREVNKFSL